MDTLPVLFQRRLPFPLFMEAGTASIVSAKDLSGILPRDARIATLYDDWVVDAMQTVWFEELSLHGLEPNAEDGAKGLMKEWLSLLRATEPLDEQEPHRKHTSGRFPLEL